MVSLNMTLNDSNTEELPTTDFQPVPEGRYKVIATEITDEQKDTGKGEVHEIVFRFEVVEPSAHAGRLIWQRWPVKSWSEKAEAFGRRMLLSFAKALGLDELKTTEPLENKPVVVRVGIDPERTVGDKTYKARNKVVAFMPPNTPLSENGGGKPAAAKKPVKLVEDEDTDSSGPWD